MHDIKINNTEFEDFCKSIGVNPDGPKQVKRKAEKLYTKGLKKSMKGYSNEKSN